MKGSLEHLLDEVRGGHPHADDHAAKTSSAHKASVAHQKDKDVKGHPPAQGAAQAAESDVPLNNGHTVPGAVADEAKIGSEAGAHPSANSGAAPVAGGGTKGSPASA